MPRFFQFQPRWGNISIQDLRSRKVLDLDFQKRPGETTKNSLHFGLPELGAGRCEWWATWVVPMQIPNSRRCAKLTCVKSIEDLRTKRRSTTATLEQGAVLCQVLYTLALARRLPPNVLALPTTWLHQMQDLSDLLDLVRRDWAVQTNSILMFTASRSQNMKSIRAKSI